MSATRQRLIGPRTFEARLERSPAKSCLRSLSRRSPVATFCFFRNFVQTTNNIKSIRGARGHGGNKKFFVPEGRKSENSSAIVSPSRIDFLKALIKRGRACRNSTASRKADGVSTHQIRTKTTYRANSKKVGRNSVVRAYWCALKSMVLGLEGCLIRCKYGDRINLEVTQSLNQALVDALIFSTRWINFSWVVSNEEGVHLGQSWFQHDLACRTICISRNS